MADLGQALIDAATGGHLEAVRTLLGQGANVEARDDYQLTPLHLAAWHGHLEVAELLLDSGASVDALSTNHLLWTPLLVASRNGHLAVVKLLVARGANVHHKDRFLWTALHHAARYDRLDVCLFLLSKGADLLAVDNKGRDALAEYGREAYPSLCPETLASRRDALTAAWRAGPHPSQVQRRRDEAWARRKSLMQVTAENRYRPLSHVSAMLAAEAVGPAAAIPAIPLDNAEQLHAHLLGQVLSNEGIHRHIVSFL